jgi:hypothetical protein
MTENRQIVIGKSIDQPAMVLRPCNDVAPFLVGPELPADGALGKVLAALHGLPDLLLAAYVSSTKLMEVQINGDLVRASDGMGYRAFSVDGGGITEQAKLFDASDLSTLVDIALVWRLASIIVGQKHLSDISNTLKKLERGVSAITQFQRDEQVAKIESAYGYLRQAEIALSNGEREPAVRHRLEAIETDMDTIQRHLGKLFESRLNAKVKHENFMGYADIEEGFPEKINDLGNLMAEHRAAGLTRAGALQMLAMYPGGEALKGARSKAIDASAQRHRSMCDSLEATIAFEASQWSGKSEAFVTNVGEFASGQSKFHQFVDDIAVSALRSAGFELKQGPKTKPRGSGASETPRLDALKMTAVSVAGTLAQEERKGADDLSSACMAMNQILLAESQPTRCLVEWGESGPSRIHLLTAT